MEPVSARAWSELLHAEVGTLLRLAGVPCLHIKGPTVATWLYDEGERPWGDVDILVSPARMDDALEVLIDSGFAYRDRGLRWRTSEDHAITLWHDPAGVQGPSGAAEVDVHHRFQGIETDPERAFEELWRRREPATLAQLDVWFPDLTTRALLVVLNVARDPRSGRAREDLRRLVASGDDRDWARAIALATRLDALESFRAGLELDPDGARHRRAHRARRRDDLGRHPAAGPGLEPHGPQDRGAARPGAGSQGQGGRWLGGPVTRGDPLPRPHRGGEHLADGTRVRRPLPRRRYAA